MTERITPNPPSEWATADPDTRHLLPSLFGALPSPGLLSPTACGELAVVPEETLRDMAGGSLPPGLCPRCIAHVNGAGGPDLRPRSACECGSQTPHAGLCVLCRQDAQEKALAEAAGAA